MQLDNSSGDALADSVREVLEENGLFLSYDEDTLYFIPHEAILALAWLATAVVVPILTNLASDEIRDAIDARKTKPGPPELDPGATTASQAVVSQTIALIATPLKIARKDRDRAVATTAELLTSRGWPRDLAEEDAEEIVDRVCDSLEK